VKLSAEVLGCGTQLSKAQRPFWRQLKDDLLLPLAGKVGIVWPSIPLLLILMVIGIRKALNMWS
jgi:hypothetical protein